MSSILKEKKNKSMLFWEKVNVKKISVGTMYWVLERHKGRRMCGEYPSTKKKKKNFFSL